MGRSPGSSPHGARRETEPTTNRPAGCGSRFSMRLRFHSTSRKLYPQYTLAEGGPTIIKVRRRTETLKDYPVARVHNHETDRADSRAAPGNRTTTQSHA